MVIYITTNLINGKKYIGRDSKNDPKYLGSGCALMRAIKKYGKHNFKKEIIEECFSFDDLQKREEYWLNHYDAGRSAQFYNMHNHSSGGPLSTNITNETRKKLRDFNLGKKLSIETRLKMSESRQGDKNHFFGKTHSEESRKKIKEARRNQVIHISEETKQKIRDAQKGISRPGKKHSEETKRKLSEINRGELHPNFGKKHSEEHKKKIGESLSGLKNPSYGKKWLYNEQLEVNTFIHETLSNVLIENGWRFGVRRKFKTIKI